MSFQIKDKKKIALFRKSVQIITSEKEDFFMHFSKTHIRLFNMFRDESTYMVDFQAPWFSKFMAPNVILNDEQGIEILQIRVNRDIFLQSFNLLDDSELEFLVSINNEAEFGKLKVIKTRDQYIIEANVGFDIEKQIQCDENYNFPEEQLLLNSNPKQLKNLRGIFKNKSKIEVLQLSFLKNQLVFKGEFNKKFDYEVKSNTLDNYGNYLENGNEKVEEFQINLGLKHIVGLIKICELVEGNFMSAMELLSANSCVNFLFTHNHQRDFKFIIGIGNVAFQKINEQQFVQGNQNKLKKQNQLPQNLNPPQPKAPAQSVNLTKQEPQESQQIREVKTVKVEEEHGVAATDQDMSTHPATITNQKQGGQSEAG
mmetsp:Transcript_1833/g.3209  ORF Transcript_1833/g.3209 Transcript_1833/m.3209 type:complete len:370 (-) Transcript_1833:226-1335(-)